jgi:hypothetical protein
MSCGWLYRHTQTSLTAVRSLPKKSSECKQPLTLPYWLQPFHGSEMALAVVTGVLKHGGGLFPRRIMGSIDHSYSCPHLTSQHGCHER